MTIFENHRDTPYAGPDEKSLDLIAQIVGANVKNLAWTTDRVIESLEAQVRNLAENLVDLGEILDQATVIDRETEFRLSQSGYMFVRAQETLNRLGESK